MNFVMKAKFLHSISSLVTERITRFLSWPLDRGLLINVAGFSLA